MSWIHDTHKEALEIIRGIGLDPNNIPAGSVDVDGDILTVREFTLDEDGHKILDGDEYRKHTRTYRLHPVEPLEEPA
jgi:hypothetical protein